MNTDETQTGRAHSVETADTEAMSAAAGARADEVEAKYVGPTGATGAGWLPPTPVDVRAHQAVAATAPAATVPQVQDENLLSMDEILKGGDDPYTRLEVPGLSKNGKPGVVYIRQAQAAQIIAFAAMTEGSPERKQEQFRLVGAALVTKDGRPIFDEGEWHRVGEMPVGAFTTILKAVTEEATGETGDEAKND